MHIVYKNCTRFIQLMHAKYIQNLYKMYPTFSQTFVWELNFVNKMYTKVC